MVTFIFAHGTILPYGWTIHKTETLTLNFIPRIGEQVCMKGSSKLFTVVNVIYLLESNKITVILTN